jgi:hypothetical protein
MMYPKVHIFGGEHVYFNGLVTQYPPISEWLIILSSSSHTMQGASIHYVVALDAATGPSQTRLGQSTQFN